MTKNDLPKSSQELITRFLPDSEQGGDVTQVDEKQFQEALMNLHLAMMGKRKNKFILPFFLFALAL